MKTDNRILAYVLIFAGIIILIGKFLTFGTFLALVMIIFGVRKVRTTDVKIGYTLIAIGGAILLLEHLALFIGIVLLSLGVFYFRMRAVQRHKQMMKRHSFASSLKWDRVPFHLQSQSLWHVIGESDIDLSLAMLDEPETTLFFQGVMGDVDITIPDHIGVEIEATVLFGHIDVEHNKETGFFNKWTWRSPHYDSTEQKVKLNLSYIVGDIDIRIH
ncbi:cell wall-active antibiotics response protein LiaF [Paenibacillus sp. SC116]|uniref:cell wall-active antibiotics response protein LiaF n=1 Tax=Paenibacillus sp. SC116 TaxID=2968986 RepID=UPI00215A3F8E|nr:cell wall-active antibiotics response protein LiaF [Paenibacillus sp. SC116]MCR8846017.1 cell wall-active antibiotics response protein LiaF [Paenibacillus sp. SC116]